MGQFARKPRTETAVVDQTDTAPVVAPDPPVVDSPPPAIEDVVAPPVDLEVVATPPPVDLAAEIARLRAENEQLKQQKIRTGTTSLRVSEKGAVSVYGLGKFPVTLYKEQMERLLGMADEIRTFIKDHESELKLKVRAA